jgi:hypothetical protein
MVIEPYFAKKEYQKEHKEKKIVKKINTPHTKARKHPFWHEYESCLEKNRARIP